MPKKQSLEEMHQAVDDLMRTPLEANLLKFEAGSMMFCGCRKLMDWRDTVIVTAHSGDECLNKWVLCGGCYDKAKAHIDDGFARARKAKPERNFTQEVVDGREARFNDLEPDAVLTAED